MVVYGIVKQIEYNFTRILSTIAPIENWIMIAIIHLLTDTFKINIMDKVIVSIFEIVPNGSDIKFFVIKLNNEIVNTYITFRFLVVSIFKIVVNRSMVTVASMMISGELI